MSHPDTGDRLWGAKLRELRQAAGMPRVRLAELVFVDATAVSSWERGRTLPSLETYGRLLEQFPALPKLRDLRERKPEGNTSSHGPRAVEAGAVWRALAEVGAAAREYRPWHLDVRCPERGDGQVLGREGDRVLVMFRREIRWLGAAQVAAMRTL